MQNEQANHPIHLNLPIPGGNSVEDSRSLLRVAVTFLVVELNDFHTAAQVVSGIEPVFNRYVSLINEAITQVEKQPRSSSFTSIEQILEAARADIRENRSLAMDILAVLPDDARTLSLRLALRDAAAARTRLLHAIMMAPDRWLDAQTKAFRLTVTNPPIPE
jgi:hypothetical protein